MSDSGRNLSATYVAASQNAAIVGPNAGSNVLTGQFSLRWLAKKWAALATSTGQQIQWLVMGTSVAAFKPRELLPYVIDQAGGQPGAKIWSGSSSGSGASTAGVTSNALSGAITERDSDYDAFPNFITFQYNQAASIQYGISGNYSPICDHIEVYYVTGPASNGLDGGTFSYQVDGGAATDVSTAGASIGLGILTLTPAHGTHQFQLNWVSGSCRIIGVGIWDSTVNGVIPIDIGQGGINMYLAEQSALDNLTTFLAHVQPDFITLEAKASQLDANAGAGGTGVTCQFVADLLASIAAGTTSCDMVVIGSTPDGFGEQQTLVNQLCAEKCQAVQPTLNAFMWDGYTPLVDWATVTALGWGNDDPHLPWQAQVWLASLMARDIGLFDLVNTPVARDPTVNTVSAASEYLLGNNGDHLKIVAEGSGSHIAQLVGAEAIEFVDGSGNMSARITTGGGEQQFIGNLTRVGDDATNSIAFLYGNQYGIYLVRDGALDPTDVFCGNVRVQTNGNGLRVAEGANAKQGTATLTGGTVTVSNTAVTPNSRIFLTAQDGNTTGALRVSARTAGNSFTITSSVGTDSGVVAYEIFEPS